MWNDLGMTEDNHMLGSLVYNSSIVITPRSLMTSYTAEHAIFMKSHPQKIKGEKKEKEKRKLIKPVIV